MDTTVDTFRWRIGTCIIKFLWEMNIPGFMFSLKISRPRVRKNNQYLDCTELARYLKILMVWTIIFKCWAIFFYHKLYTWLKPNVITLTFNQYCNQDLYVLFFNPKMVSSSFVNGFSSLKVYIRSSLIEIGVLGWKLLTWLFAFSPR